MLSHVEMAPAAAGGFKLFGKVITQLQCAAETAPPPAVPTPEQESAAASRRAAAFARERDDPDERDQPMVKREAAASGPDHDFGVADKQLLSAGAGGPAPAESEDSKVQHPRPRHQQQHQDSADQARAAAAASSAPPLPCPRCRSRNTKFCYFNNYNVNQPRHFCKDCHRYWTAGGALRNVPVGAGRRKNRPLGGPAGVVGAGAGGTVPVSLPVHHHHHLHHAAQAAVAAGFVLGFPGQQHPSSPTTSPSPVVFAEPWPVCPDRRF